MRIRVLAAATLFALLVAACGEGEKGQVNSETPVVLETGPPSALFGVALPKGATKTPAAPGAEAYRAVKTDTIRYLQGFYDREMAGKPFRGYEWCGGSSNTTNTKAVILWRKADTNDLLRLALDANDPAGVLIVVTDEKNAAPTLCPPGPVDSVPNEDLGDMPGV